VRGAPGNRGAYSIANAEIGENPRTSAT
jgi:hypothetical protein